MVPFAEVVLLTAMEHQREDEDKELTETSLTAAAATADEEEDKAMLSVAGWSKILRWCLPQLKTLGLFHAFFLQFICKFNNFFREKGAPLSGFGKLCCLLHLGFDLLF